MHRIPDQAGGSAGWNSQGMTRGQVAITWWGWGWAPGHTGAGRHSGSNQPQGGAGPSGTALDMPDEVRVQVLRVNEQAVQAVLTNVAHALAVAGLPDRPRPFQVGGAWL